MRYLIFILLLVTVLFTAGCINVNNTVVVTPAPTVRTPAPVPPVSGVPTVIKTTVPEKTVPENTGDREFLDAVETCYNTTPVIKDVKTNLEFTICMQHTTIPTGECAKQFRKDILTYTTKDDSTTAGFARETHNMQVARARYDQCMGYGS